MTPEDRLRLESRLRQAQPDLDDEAVRRVLAKVSADERATDVALRWARLDEVPTTPDVEGLNPATLISAFEPSVALTALPHLYTDPRGVLETLQNPPPGWSVRTPT
jgi:hypothetical protein